jgi:hypothetical protein
VHEITPEASFWLRFMHLAHRLSPEDRQRCDPMRLVHHGRASCVRVAGRMPID